MNPLQRLAHWICWYTDIPLGPLAPHVLGFALGSSAQRVPVLVLTVRSCTDRMADQGCTPEQKMPALRVRGGCNSSHGGSCCACGGPLPDVHDHLHTDCTSCPKHGVKDWGFGGNVCSAHCLGDFIQWLEDAPPRTSICPGHRQDWGGGTKVFGSWGRHHRHSVEVRRVK